MENEEFLEIGENSTFAKRASTETNSPLRCERSVCFVSTICIILKSTVAPSR